MFEGLVWRGELAALSAAWVWAIATLVYAQVGQRLSPLVLNFAKGCVALGLISVTLAWQPQSVALLGELVHHHRRELGWLCLSGALGIGISDTFYFQTLNYLGARQTLLMGLLAAPFTTVMAAVVLQERLTAAQLLGMGLTIAGVGWVISERTVDRVPIGATRHYFLGIGFGLLTTATHAVGALLSRAVLSQGEINPLWTTQIRLFAGVGLTWLWLCLSPLPLSQQLQPLRSPKLSGTIALTAFFSTYLAIWLQQIAFKLTAAGIVQALSATSPLFVLPFAAAMGERVSLRAVLGAIVAIGGIGLLVR
ncbi:DMT family transporter [Trichothermofontia sichuanensis B231]|uniref:DMT family transporter n=1 Tax=Trichothermofontia sichuanensis TaxID=3045816 RepID=UPI0022461DC0|nr:DMT family transporter [Trichothermofontia sichuanensis]UZQ53102.1 DMT family transporter [Trichothermofontia sichuanensis B231]